MYGFGADRLKLLLMPLVCILSFGLPGRVGGMIRDLCRFAPLAFYILSGFFILVEDSVERWERLKHAALSSGIFFALLTLFYTALNIGLLSLQGADWAGTLLTKRVVFNFLVLCVFPFQTGECLWFIQSLFYACLILLLLDLREHLPFFVLPLLIVTSVLMLLCGEFAGLLNFRFLGYSYIPANALTRALPYLLLGSLLRRHSERLFLPSPLLYWVLFFFGALLAVGEILLLSYFDKLVYLGHTIGYGMMAVSACCLALTNPEEELGWLFRHARCLSRFIYAMHQPVGLILPMILPVFGEPVSSVILISGGVSVFLFTFLTALPVGAAEWSIRRILHKPGRFIYETEI